MRLLLPALLLASVLPLPAAKLGQDTWREEKRGQTLDGLRHWSRLTEPSSGTIVDAGGRRALRLTDGARMQSVGVLPYGGGMTLRGLFDVTSSGGTAGFGFIDFSSGIYYYLYVDKTAGKIILQRGDAESSQVLAEAPAAPASPMALELNVDTTDKKTIRLAASLNGTALLQAGEEKPPKLGSTYQIYVGLGGDTVADLYEMTAILGK